MRLRLEIELLFFRHAFAAARNVECRMKNVEEKTMPDAAARNVECRMKNVECRMKNVEENTSPNSASPPVRVNPQSAIPNPQSASRPVRVNPQSAIPNPQSVSRPVRVNPQFAIPNPQSAIPNPQSAIPNPQSAIPNPQSSSPDHQIARSPDDPSFSFLLSPSSFRRSRGRPRRDERARDEPPSVEEMHRVLRRERRRKGSTAASRCLSWGFLNPTRLLRAIYVAHRMSVTEMEVEILKELRATWTWDARARRFIVPGRRPRQPICARERDRELFAHLVSQAPEESHKLWQERRHDFDPRDPMFGTEQKSHREFRDPREEKRQDIGSRDSGIGIRDSGVQHGDAEKAEGQRPKAEGQRPKAEGQRPKAEGQRPKAEGQRPKAEGQRPKAEGQRPKAEGQRPKAEGQRPKAEGQRPKAEGQRPKAEGQRPKAEIADPGLQGQPAGGCPSLPPVTEPSGAVDSLRVLRALRGEPRADPKTEAEVAATCTTCRESTKMTDYSKSAQDNGNGKELLPSPPCKSECGVGEDVPENARGRHRAREAAAVQFSIGNPQSEICNTQSSIRNRQSNDTPTAEETAGRRREHRSHTAETGATHTTRPAQTSQAKPSPSNRQSSIVNRQSQPSPFNQQSAIGNPQSAIRNPQSAIGNRC
jgi:hypothetical protein